MSEIKFNLDQQSLLTNVSTRQPLIQADSVDELRTRFAEILQQADRTDNPTVVYSQSSDSATVVTDAGIFYQEAFDHSRVMHPFAQAIFDQNFDRTSGDLWREAAIPILLADLQDDDEINGYFTLQQYAKVFSEIEPSNNMSDVIFKGSPPEGVMSAGFQKRVNEVIAFLFNDLPVSVMPSPSILDLFDILSSIDPSVVQKIETTNSQYTIRNSELLLQQIYRNPTTLQRLIATVERAAQLLEARQLIGTDAESDQAVQAAIGSPDQIVARLSNLVKHLQMEFDQRYSDTAGNISSE